MITKDDIPVCPDCIQGKHTNCTGTSWNNTKDEETYCPCAIKNHPETWMDDIEPKTSMTREEFEEILGQPIMNWQWERIANFVGAKQPQVSISKEDLFTNRPSMIDIIREEIEQSWLKTIRRDKL